MMLLEYWYISAAYDKMDCKHYVFRYFYSIHFLRGTLLNFTFFFLILRERNCISYIPSLYDEVFYSQFLPYKDASLNFMHL